MSQSKRSRRNYTPEQKGVTAGDLENLCKALLKNSSAPRGGP
jgi:hypothetical protein